MSNGDSDLSETEVVNCDLEHNHTRQCYYANRDFSSYSSRIISFENQCFDVWVGNMSDLKKRELAAAGFYFDGELVYFCKCLTKKVCCRNGHRFVLLQMRFKICSGLGYDRPT